MNGGHVLAGLPGQNDKGWQLVLLNAVKPAKKHDFRILWLDRKLGRNGSPSVLCGGVLPLKIPGRRDDAAVLLPRLPEDWLFCRGLRSCVYYWRISPLNSEAPDHGEESRLLLPFRCQYRRKIRGPDFSASCQRCCIGFFKAMERRRTLGPLQDRHEIRIIILYVKAAAHTNHLPGSRALQLIVSLLSAYRNTPFHHPSHLSIESRYRRRIPG